MTHDSDTDGDPATVEELFEQLSEEWGTVYVCRRESPMHDDEMDRYCVRNHTDEGLGADEWKSAYGKTLVGALHSALVGNHGYPRDDE